MIISIGSAKACAVCLSTGHYETVLATVEDPDFVLRGQGGSLIAARGHGRKRYLKVIYRQLTAQEGFVITAFFASKIERKRIVWQKH